MIDRLKSIWLWDSAIRRHLAGKNEAAELVIRKIKLGRRGNVKLSFMIAKSLHSNGKYAEAIGAYDEFLENASATNSAMPADDAHYMMEYARIYREICAEILAGNEVFPDRERVQKARSLRVSDQTEGLFPFPD